MTDTKATPATDKVATDEEISLMRPIYGYGPNPTAADGMVRMLFARIASDGETIRNHESQARDARVYIANLEAERVALRAHVAEKDEEIERLKVLCGEHAKASLEWQGLYEVSQAKLIGRIERDAKKHCGCMVGEPCSWTHVKYHHPTVGMAKIEAENATLRAQVETLRQAISGLVDAEIGTVDAAVDRGRAALAATESKG